MMFTSNRTTNYSGNNVVENIGAISLLPPSSPRDQPRVCLVQENGTTNWVLPHCIRYANEVPSEAMLNETGAIGCGTRLMNDEAFMLTVRQVNDQGNWVILFWWYIVFGEEMAEEGWSTDALRAEFCGYNEAMKRLKRPDERDVLARAVERFRVTYYSHHLEFLFE